MTILHPYRSQAKRIDAGHAEQRDDYILAAMLVGLGGWRVVLAFVTGESFGTEPTIAAIMTGLGVLLVLATFGRR
jgi:hypothetical protein